MSPYYGNTAIFIQDLGTVVSRNYFIFKTPRYFHELTSPALVIPHSPPCIRTSAALSIEVTRLCVSRDGAASEMRHASYTANRNHEQHGATPNDPRYGEGSRFLRCKENGWG